MKPTELMRNQLRKSMQDRAVNVTYYPFLRDKTITDERTMEPELESLAYGAAVVLPAIVIEAPSISSRQAFGLEEELFIEVRLHVDEILDRSIVFHIGDKILFNKRTYFLQHEPLRKKQVQDEYLEYRLAVVWVEGRSEVIE
jgi:hypothetical protein